MNAKRRQDCRYVWPTCKASAYARYDLSRCRTHHRGFSLRALPETLVSDSFLLSPARSDHTSLAAQRPRCLHGAVRRYLCDSLWI